MAGADKVGARSACFSAARGMKSEAEGLSLGLTAAPACFLTDFLTMSPGCDFELVWVADLVETPTVGLGAAEVEATDGVWKTGLTSGCSQPS